MVHDVLTLNQQIRVHDVLSFFGARCIDPFQLAKEGRDPWQVPNRYQPPYQSNYQDQWDEETPGEGEGRDENHYEPTTEDETRE